MTCGKKHCDNAPTEATKVDHTEVEGRPLCDHPGCEKRVVGDGTRCADGHVQGLAPALTKLRATCQEVVTQLAPLMGDDADDVRETLGIALDTQDDAALCEVAYEADALLSKLVEEAEQEEDPAEAAAWEQLRTRLKQAVIQVLAKAGDNLAELGSGRGTVPMADVPELVYAFLGGYLPGGIAVGEAIEAADEVVLLHYPDSDDEEAQLLIRHGTQVEVYSTRADEDEIYNPYTYTEATEATIASHVRDAGYGWQQHCPRCGQFIPQDGGHTCPAPVSLQDDAEVPVSSESAVGGGAQVPDGMAGLYATLQACGVVVGDTFIGPATGADAARFWHQVWDDLVTLGFPDQPPDVGHTMVVETEPGGGATMVVLAHPKDEHAPGPRMEAAHLYWPSPSGYQGRTATEFVLDMAEFRQRVAQGLAAYPAGARGWTAAQQRVFGSSHEAVEHGLAYGPSDASRTAACADPMAALLYAINVDRRPHAETRRACCEYTHTAFQYAQEVDNGPSVETRTACCQNPNYALRYALEIDQGPHAETRRACTLPETAFVYAADVDKGSHPDTWAVCQKSRSRQFGRSAYQSRFGPQA